MSSFSSVHNVFKDFIPLSLRCSQKGKAKKKEREGKREN
jgi:hypothetical protein